MCLNTIQNTFNSQFSFSGQQLSWQTEDLPGKLAQYNMQALWCYQNINASALAIYLFDQPMADEQSVPETCVKPFLFVDGSVQKFEGNSIAPLSWGLDAC